VVVVVEENHEYAQIRGNPDAPFLNALVDGPNAALFTNAFAIEHPSQPNYLDLFAGANQGVSGDTVPAAPLTTPNLGAALLAAGRSFTGYSEDLPAVGSLADSAGSYFRKHNPWSDWQGAGANGLPAATNQPFTAFPADFTQLPTVAFVVPNQLHDMHDGTVAAADDWLRQNLGG
jgi:acid phosphatase